MFYLVEKVPEVSGDASLVFWSESVRKRVSRAGGERRSNICGEAASMIQYEVDTAFFARRFADTTPRGYLCLARSKRLAEAAGVVISFWATLVLTLKSHLESSWSSCV